MRGAVATHRFLRKMRHVQTSAVRTEAAVAEATRSAHDPHMVVAFVVPHDPSWKDAFFKEASAIEDALSSSSVELHHVGSTAIPGILAKPIIDLLGVVPSLTVVDEKTRALEGLGYEAMGSYGIEGRRYFRKIDGEGRRTHHLHVFEAGSQHIERHLAFREYLTAHADIAAEYSSLKTRLAGGDDPSWDNYMDGKDPFIRAVEPKAITWYRRVRGT